MSASPEELSAEEVARLFRESGALLEGHSLLSSGMHSPFYLQCARVLMEPARAMRVCAALLAKLRRDLPDLLIHAVVAPALGGVVLGYELGRQLGVLSVFVERETGRFALRRGFTLEPGSCVLLAEDVVLQGDGGGKVPAMATSAMPKAGNADPGGIPKAAPASRKSSTVAGSPGQPGATGA